MMDKPKVIVAHPGRQHSFRVAKALKEAGLLYKYVTTIYDKEDSVLMKVAKLFLNRENKRRASNRKCASLEDSDVVLMESFLSYILLFVYRVDKQQRFARWLNDFISKRFQIKLAKYAIKEDVDVVICYDANCRYCFEYLKEHAPRIKRVMDNAAPNRNYLNKIYTENKEKCGPFVKALSKYKYLFDKSEAKRFVDEISYVDYHIVASDFSKKALEYDGVSDNHIFVVGYGIDANRFIDEPRIYDKGKLNLIYVGEVNQRKGIYQICEAAKKLNNPNIEFNIIGTGYEAQKALLSPYEKYVTFHGPQYFEKLQNHLKHNHVFLFPSMGDGFGLVLLEAMAAGLPVIASYNSAGPDIVSEGDNGFLIDTCDENALISKIKWFLNNQDKMQRMSKRAIETARLFTWERYESGIVNAVSNIINRKKL